MLLGSAGRRLYLVLETGKFAVSHLITGIFAIREFRIAAKFLAKTRHIYCRCYIVLAALLYRVTTELTHASFAPGGANPPCSYFTMQEDGAPVSDCS